jgi:hypothetical protein
MRIEGISLRIALLAAALAGFGLAAVAQSGAPAKKAAAAKPSGPLLRKDLLAGVRVGVSPFRRDIFLPQGPGAGMPLVLASPMGAPPRPAASAVDEKPAEEAPPVAVRYVGFIRAQGKFLALVLIDGQSAALAEGDEAGAAGRIVRIASNEIEILGPDGKSFKLPLEGERK